MTMHDVIFWWMVFGVVICQVVAPFVPEDSESLLRFSVFEPIESHVE